MTIDARRKRIKELNDSISHLMNSSFGEGGKRRKKMSLLKTWVLARAKHQAAIDRETEYDANQTA